MRRFFAGLLALMLFSLPALAEEKHWVVPDGFEGLTGSEEGMGTWYMDSIIYEKPWLEEITLPASMDETTFRIFMAELRSLYSDAVYQTMMGGVDAELVLPDYYAAGYRLTKIHIAPEHETLCSVDGVVFSKDMKTLIACPPARRGSYAVPDGVEVIAEDAFEHCDTLEKIALPMGLRKIGTYAFYSAGGLVSINLPPTLEEIGDSAFLNCIGLKSLILPDGVSVGENVFKYMYGLETLLAGKNVKMDEEALFYVPSTALVFCPEGSEVSRAAAVGQLRQAELGGEPKLLKSPWFIYENPAVLTADYEDLFEMDSVNILAVEGGLARVEDRFGEKFTVPYDLLALVDPYRGYERLLGMPAGSYEITPIRQRFGTWFVTGGEGEELYFHDAGAGRVIGNCVAGALYTLTEKADLVDDEGNTLATFYPGEQLLIEDRDMGYVQIGGLYGWMDVSETSGVREENEPYFY